MKHLFKWLLIFFPVAAFSQEGSVTVVQDTSIDRVLTLYQKFAKEQRAVSGFRVQLGASTNRKELMDMKTRFLQLYPDVGTYLEYQQPLFKLRVGNFITRNDANDFWNEIKEMFSASFIVPSKVYITGVEW